MVKFGGEIIGLYRDSRNKFSRYSYRRTDTIDVDVRRRAPPDKVGSDAVQIYALYLGHL